MHIKLRNRIISDARKLARETTYYEKKVKKLEKKKKKEVK